jgi:SAM-dependent methyltransferase
MQNSDQWKPNRLKWNEQKQRFDPNKAVVYSGSLHIAKLQLASYIPLIQKYCQGNLLDCGCGQVPYYDVYKDKIKENTCIDWESTHGANPYVDKVVDLSGTLPFDDDHFDSALMTDVIAHIYKPGDLFKEIGRVLKPGGCLVVGSPFFYWISEPPHEYFRFTEYSFRRFCEDAGMEIVHLEPYGGRIDVMLDLLNKKMSGPISNRIFLLISSLIAASGYYRRSVKRTEKKYPIGYSLVARKR